MGQMLGSGVCARWAGEGVEEHVLPLEMLKRGQLESLSVPNVTGGLGSMELRGILLGMCQWSDANTVT